MIREIKKFLDNLNKVQIGDKNINLILRYISMYFLVNIYLMPFFTLFLGTILTYGSYFFLNLFFDVSLSNGGIFWNNIQFLVVEECIAISAYILLTFLFLSMPLKNKVLFKGLGYSMLAFTIANYLRIILLMSIFILFGENIFNKLHFLFYQALTGIILGLIFVFYYRRYKIKQKPLVDDYKYIFSLFKKS